MTSDLSQTARPVAISFKDFRDEEIVDFFANENRMFHPETKPNCFGRSRLVGAPHFPMERKGTAAFCVSFHNNRLPQEKYSSHNGILLADSIGTIPVPPDIFAFTNKNNTNTVTASKRSFGKHSQNSKRKQTKNIELSFVKSSRLSASALVTAPTDRKRAINLVADPLENETKNFPLSSNKTPVNETESSEKTESIPQYSFEPVRETDAQLDRLIETWPRLSSQIKETITTLLEVSESE
ncbi:MAG: hypothetical protein LBI18_00975 [Planctomycetaceae bacterium]|jgi:hypothetical protein|nr:hypothetical protein [Planctomycetaceae bacterium]